MLVQISKKVAIDNGQEPRSTIKQVYLNDTDDQVEITILEGGQELLIELSTDDVDYALVRQVLGVVDPFKFFG